MKGVTFNDKIVAEDMQYILKHCESELLTLADKSILITGGSGFIGSYLVTSLIAYNATHPEAACKLFLPTRSLKAMKHKFPHWLENIYVHCFEWDGNGIFLFGCEVDYIIHAASPVDPSLFMQKANASLLQMVRYMEAITSYARAFGVSRILYLSSGAVYGKQPESVTHLLENYIGEAKISAYGEGKRFCERMSEFSGLPVVIVRLFSVIGPYLDLNSGFSVADFIRNADQSGEILLNSDGSSVRTWCYASDMAIILWKLLIHGNTGTAYNVGRQGPELTILEIAKLIATYFDVPVKVKEGAVAALVRNRYVPDTSKIGGFHLPTVDISEALQRSLISMYIRGKLKQKPIFSGGNYEII